MALKRSLGLFELTLYGVGMIVGAGIYVLIGKVAGLAGYGTWLSFLLSSLLAIFTGLSYAELASKFKEDAAEYAYVKKAIKNEFLAHLTAWLMLSAIIISGSTVALGFAGYLGSILNINHITALAILAIALFSWINYRGINLSAKINDFSTLLEVGGLLLLIIGVSTLTVKGEFSIPDFTQFNVKDVVSGAILAFFAYIGFGSIAKMSEEVKNPQRNIPWAIILSILITTLLYVAIAGVAVIAVNPAELASSSEPAALIASKIHPSLSIVLSIIAIFSTGNTLLLILISASRLLYGLSHYNVFPKVFSKVSKKTHTPYISVIKVGIVSSILALFKKIEIVASVTNLWTFITYFLVNLSVIFLRRKESKKRIFKKGFKSPLNIGNFPLFALLGILASLIMIAYPFINKNINIKQPEIWLTLLLITLATFHYLFKKRKGQASLEYLIVVTLSLLILSPMIYYALEYKNELDDVKPIIDLKRTMKLIKENSDFVFSQGIGAKISIKIVIPKQVVLIEQGNTYLKFRLKANYGEEDFVILFPYNITGSFPTQPGYYKLIIEGTDKGVSYESHPL